jgi:hypothetical protein
MLRSIATDPQLWVPVAVLLVGIALLVAVQ